MTIREAPHDARFPENNLILGPASSANKRAHDASWRQTLSSLQTRADRHGDVRFGQHDALRPRADMLRNACRAQKARTIQNTVHTEICPRSHEIAT